MIINRGRSKELSKQQIECLERLGNGQTFEEICQAMALSEITISLMISNAKEKLDASSTTHAVVISMKENLIHI